MITKKPNCPDNTPGFSRVKETIIVANRIVLNTISYHGKGAVENILPELTARGYKKAFVCTDPDLIRFGVAEKVTMRYTATSRPIPPSRMYSTVLLRSRLRAQTAS